MTSRRLLVGLSAASAIAIVGFLLPRYLAVEPSRTVTVPFVLVAMLGALGVAFRRLVADSDRPSLPAPELSRPARTPGDGFDDRLDGVRPSRRGEESYSRQRIRDRVRTVARETLVAARRVSSEEATDRLRNGSWTNDDGAAAFLRGERTHSSSLRQRLPPRTDSAEFRDGVARTVGSLLRIAGRTPTTRARRSAVERLAARLRGTATAEAASGYTVTPSERTLRVTDRWRGISAVALVGVGLGIAFERAGVILVAAVGVGYAAYARTTALPPLDVSATRSIADENPDPGDELVVTVTVRNNGSRPLPDVRIIDGVPGPLGVETGSPRHGTTLPAGSETTFTYAVRARRGRHEFGPVRVLARDLAETVERDATVDPETAFTCRPPASPTIAPPVRREVTQFVGQVAATTGGDGVEFHSTREYRPGDPQSRIDWKRLARTGELTTVEFREERAATVVLVADGRAAAHAAPEPDAPTACDRGANAAARLVGTFRRDGNAVGLAALSPSACWVSPGSSRAVESRVRDRLTTHPAFDQRPADGTCYTGDWVDEFRHRFGHPAQVMLFSPLVDEGSVRVARSLEAYGYPVTVVSPDPTATDTVGRRLAHLERRIRLHELRRAGVRVVDWKPDGAFEAALLRATRRWSR